MKKYQSKKRELDDDSAFSKNFGQSIRYKRRLIEERMAREDALRDIKEDEELNAEVRRIFTTSRY